MLAPLIVSLFVAHADVGTPPAQVSPAALLPETPTAMAGIGGGAVRFTGYCMGSGDCGGMWGIGGAASLGADVPVGEGMAVRAQAFGAAADSDPLGGLWVSLRGPVVEERRLVVSPWVAAGMGIFYGEFTSGGLAGLAIDTGGDHVRVDVSIPLVGAVADPDSGVEPFYLEPIAVIGEFGVRWEVGERSSLRAGMMGILPGVDWQRQIGDNGKRLQIGVHGLGFVNTARVGFSQPL